MESILLLSQLIETLRKMAGRKHELDKVYFEQFIEPAWEVFQKIHEDYKKSFNGYRDYILSEEYTSDRLAEKLRDDSIDTANLRIELMKIIEHIPTTTLKTRDEYLEGFAREIVNYFDYRRVLGPEASGRVAVMKYDYMTLARVEITRDILRSNHSRQQAIDILRAAFLKLQKNYEKVSDAYYKLRTDLLN